MGIAWIAQLGPIYTAVLPEFPTVESDGHSVDCTAPSGHVVFDQMTPERLAPSRQASVKLAPVRLAPYRLTLYKFAPVRLALVRLALVSAALVKSQP